MRVRWILAKGTTALPANSGVYNGHATALSRLNEHDGTGQDLKPSTHQVAE